MDSEFHKGDRDSHIHMKFKYHGVNAFTFNPDLFKLDTLVIRKRGHRSSVFLISVIRELHFVAVNPQYTSRTLLFFIRNPCIVVKTPSFLYHFLCWNEFLIYVTISFNSNQWYVIFRSDIPNNTSIRFFF